VVQAVQAVQDAELARAEVRAALDAAPWVGAAQTAQTEPRAQKATTEGRAATTVSPRDSAPAQARHYAAQSSALARSA
jgi:hypothetical protein